MTPTKAPEQSPLVKDVLQAFDNLNGSHPGFRPAHAKGILLSGLFTPSAGGRELTTAPHVHRPSTPVWVRFSDFAGIPAIPDNSPDASPRGMAIRFYLAEHVHTDIVAHSVDGFPARTAEEFVEFLRAIGASGAGAPKPSPVEQFLGTHPAALAFVQAPKPMPASFATESYFGVSAYRFTNDKGVSQFGRYQIQPNAGSQHLDAQTAGGAPADFLFDEIRERLGKGPVQLRILVQLAQPGDVVDDSTIQWPQERPKIEFGTLALTDVAMENAAEQKHVIFDPVPRVEGISPSGDPLLQPRADVYLASGRRRRSEAS